tara:strand:+ start:338 stop:646 length:309 start_codon:yes stop_codon:yes gene_type:complete
MLGGRGRTKRAVGSMRGKKISGLGALRARKAARAARTPATPATPRTPQTQARAARKMASRLGAVATRGGRPTPRRRSPFRRAQQKAALRGARGRPRVQARRG